MKKILFKISGSLVVGDVNSPRDEYILLIIPTIVLNEDEPDIYIYQVRHMTIYNIITPNVRLLLGFAEV
jgi:hypothetical protein